MFTSKSPRCESAMRLFTRAEARERTYRELFTCVGNLSFESSVNVEINGDND